MINQFIPGLLSSTRHVTYIPKNGCRLAGGYCRIQPILSGTFLLPAPSTNYHGVVRSELRYAIGLCHAEPSIFFLVSRWFSHIYLPSDPLLDPALQSFLSTISDTVARFSQSPKGLLGRMERSGVRQIRPYSQQIHYQHAKGRSSCPSLTKSGPALGARPGRTFRRISQVTTRSSRRHCAMFISPEVACAPSRPF